MLFETVDQRKNATALASASAFCACRRRRILLIRPTDNLAVPSAEFVPFGIQPFSAAINSFILRSLHIEHELDEAWCPCLFRVVFNHAVQLSQDMCATEPVSGAVLPIRGKAVMDQYPTEFRKNALSLHCGTSPFVIQIKECKTVI